MNNSERGWVLHVCNNANQCAVALPIARCLREEHGIESKFLSLDAYYDQGVGSALASREFPFAELPSKVCAGRYYEEIDLRSAFVWEASVEVFQLFEELTPAAILLGHDVELIEQLIVREAERRGIPTARIQDGITGPIQRNDEVALHTERYVFEGGCDLNLTWNDYIRDNLVERFLPSRAVTVGDPRTDHLLDWKSSVTPGAPYTILIAGQVWAKHLTMTFSQEIAIYERIIRQFLARPDTKIVFRPHPAQVHNEVFLKLPEAFDGRVEVSEEGSLYEALKHVDVVVGVSSTVTIESAMLGIPTFRLLHLLEDNKEVFSYCETKMLELLESDEFPNVNFFGYLDKEDFVSKHAPLFDGKASGRAAQELVSMIDAKLHVVREEPKVSVLLIQSEGDVFGAANSVLRLGDFPLEILVCDLSASGSLREQLGDVAKDPRVRYLHRPGVSSGNALNEMIAAAEAPIVARLAQGSIAHPHWAESLYKALHAKPSARIAISEYTVRDEAGLIWKTHTLPDALSGSQLASMQTATLTVQAYAFRKEFVSPLPEDDLNAEGVLFTSVIGDMDDASRIAVVRGRRFYTPYDYKKREITGPRPIVRRPLFSSSESNRREVRRGLKVALNERDTHSYSLVVFSPCERSLANLGEDVLPRLSAQHSVDLIIVADTVLPDVRHRSQELIRQCSGTYIGHMTSASQAEKCNEAVAKSSGDFLLFLQPDVALSYESIEAHCLAQRSSHYSSAIVSPLELDRTLENSFTGAIFRTGLLFGEATNPRSGPLGLDCFRSLNLSIPRTFFSLEGVSFDERFKGDWGRDFWLGNRIVEHGREVCGLPGASARYAREWTLLDFLRQERERADDMIRFMNRRPEFIRTFLSIPAITSIELTTWETSVRDGLDELGEVFEKVYQAIRFFEQGEGLSAALEQELMTLVEHLVQFVCVRQLVRHYLNVKDFAQLEINNEIL